MESKIQVGEYIRTQEGIIGKVKRIELDEIDKSLKWYVFDKKRYDMNIIDEIYINKPYIKSHSFNIIDLIEEGDYVNGIYVENNNGRYLETLECCYQDSSLGYIEYIKIFPSEIYSIVTKEQFKAIECEV